MSGDEEMPVEYQVPDADPEAVVDESGTDTEAVVDEADEVSDADGLEDDDQYPRVEDVEEDRA